jgi:hypothetical protein
MHNTPVVSWSNYSEELGFSQDTGKQTWESKKQTVMLGGKGRIVEIDETLMFKVKYNRGYGLKRKQIWVFGMIERDCKRGETVKKCHMEAKKKRAQNKRRMK